MKNLLSLLAVMILVSGAAMAQKAASKTAQKVEGPSIKFEKKVHSFGDVQQTTAPLKHTFVFTNTGSEPLEIKDVKTSCGCTAPFWSKEKIAPGAQGKIDISYSKGNNIGPINKSIRVYTNEADVQTVNGVETKKEGKTHVLFIKGKVVPKAAGTPSKKENSILNSNS